MVTMDSLQGGHGDAVLYALGALDGAARVRFEAHAAVCVECRDEVAEYQPVVDGLALAVPQMDPPDHLRGRLLARAQMTPAEPQTVSPSTLPFPVQTPVITRPWWRAGGGFTTALSVVSLLLALASGSYAFAAHQEMKQTALAAAHLGETLAIMYQPGVVPRDLIGTEAAPKAKGKLYLVPDRTRAVLLTYDMPRLKNGEAYQCWLTNDEERRIDGGVFTVDDQGRGRRMLSTPQQLMRYRTLGVTREPGKGSPSPTGPRILGGQL